MTSRPEVFRRDAEQKSAESNIYRFPSKPHPHTMLLVFKEFKYESAFTQGDARRLLAAGANVDGGRSSGVSLRDRRAIELPFPKQLQDSSNIMLNGFSRDPLVEKITNGLEGMINGDSGGNLGGLPGAIQGAGAQLAQAFQGAMSGNSSGLGGAISSFTTTLQNMGVQDVATITRYLMQKASPILGDIGQSINLAAGQILNPKETLAFEGVQLRQHQFSWDLYPNNQEDSLQIKRIINIMKRSVLPRTRDFTVTNANGEQVLNFERAFLTYPYVCDIYLIGVDSSSFMKFKPSLVSNMTVDYGAGGQLAIMKGGKPAGVSISLSLQELAIETANDYGEEAAEGINAVVDEEKLNNPQSTASGWTDADGNFIGP